MELPDPPEGWSIKSLIEFNEGSWSAQLWAEDAYVYGYGSSIRYALLDAIRRIEDFDYFERLSGMKKFAGVDVSTLIDEIKAKGVQAPFMPTKRRF